MEIFIGSLWILAGLFVITKRGIQDSSNSTGLQAAALAIYYICGLYFCIFLGKVSGSVPVTIFCIFALFAIPACSKHEIKSLTVIFISIVGSLTLVGEVAQYYAERISGNNPQINKWSVLAYGFIWFPCLVAQFVAIVVSKRRVRCAEQPVEDKTTEKIANKNPEPVEERIWMNGRYVELDKQRETIIPNLPIRHRR